MTRTNKNYKWATKLSKVVQIGGLNECLFQYFNYSCSNNRLGNAPPPPPLYPFSMLYRNEASLADSNYNIVSGGGVNIEKGLAKFVQGTQEVQCLNTFVTYFSLENRISCETNGY